MYSLKVVELIAVRSLMNAERQSWKGSMRFDVWRQQLIHGTSFHIISWHIISEEMDWKVKALIKILNGKKCCCWQ